MLKLRDFFYLPELDPFYRQIVQCQTGLILVAGLDAHPSAAPGAGSPLLPSGRSTIFEILAGEMLELHPAWQGLLLPAPASWGSPARSGLSRPPRHLKRRVREVGAASGLVYPDLFIESANSQPALLLIERLSSDNAQAVLAAARQMPVLAQLDTALCGAAAARQLLDLGVEADQLECLAWVLTVQRVPTLCPHCREPASPTQEQYARLANIYPHLADLASLLLLEAGTTAAADALQGRQPAFVQAQGCRECRRSGRVGDTSVFDVFSPSGSSLAALEGPSQLSQEEYLLRLAALGRLPLGDLLYLEQTRLQRTYSVLAAQEQALREANASIQRKLAELEAANRVLVQRTEVLVSIQELSQTLIASSNLQDLAARVCKRAADLCGADRVILYFYTNSRAGDASEGAEAAEMLAASGWPAHRLLRRLPASQVRQINSGSEPAAYNRLPPGVSQFDPGARQPGATDMTLSGLSVPLLAEEAQVGLMIVQTTRKARFIASEVALLQTFANQAALAMQRAGLVEMLRGKIDQLEQAQADLLQKERLEHELDLARQVQQSMLPVEFPSFAGFHFAAQNRPARQVGGDFYDVFALDEDRFGLLIGDVSDKGMPAALYMALTRSLLRAEAARHPAHAPSSQPPSPSAVLANVNRLLLSLAEPKQFVSVFYGLIDRTARTLTYARAGHDYPLLIRQGELHTLAAPGMVLGIMDQDELALEEDIVQLRPGDRLLLYTDGLTDVLNPSGSFFDLARLKELLQANLECGLEELSAAIFNGLQAYQSGAEQFDDMTLLLIGVS